MRTVLGRHVILPLRNFAQEFGLGPTKAADGGNEPGAFIGRFTVLQNDDILRPADGHGLGKHFRSVFIGAVKLPHPPEVPGGEAGGVRIRGAQIFRSGNGGAFLWPVADQPANPAVQFHLRQIRRHQSVGDDVVCLPAVGVQVPPSLGILLLRGKLLRPPGLAHDPVLPSAFPEQTEEPFVIVGSGRVQDTVFDVMRGGPAHGDEGAPFQREDLSPHEVDDMGAEELNLAVVPFLDGVLGKGGKVFMVTIHEGDGKRKVLEKLQLNLIPPASVPQDSAIAANDHGVRFCRAPHFRETIRAEP